ncbi:MAG: signal recognition particle receptor subunit alpha, partial [Planctomycetes bacterium]|nr:signal recognition particle receptor subunit alpha [Planctomycetota bacterium]
MFEGIIRGIGDAIKSLRGKGRITESNVRDGLKQVRTALLEADVNYNVANEFVERVKKQAVGQEVLRHIDPSEQIINIIYQELVRLMKGDSEKPEPMFHIAKDRPTILMLCGLQGSGKTTTCG